MNLVNNDILNEINNETLKYKDITRAELFKHCINNKLIATLHRYNEHIDLTSNFLLQQASARVLKAITKMRKVEDKEIIKQNMED